MKKLLLLLAAVVCISTTASAQDKGDWAIMPRINIYTAWDADTVFGIGAAAVSYTHLTLPTSDLV